MANRNKQRSFTNEKRENEKRANDKLYSRKSKNESRLESTKTVHGHNETNNHENEYRY